MVLNRYTTPTPPPQGQVTLHDLQKHTMDIDYFLNNVVSKGEATVADATGAGDVVVQLNALLASLRVSGVIGT